jgi:transposase InsO family protein
VRFAFVRDHKVEFPVELLCEVLKVSRSGYYAWSRRPPSPAGLRRGQLVAEIQRAHGESRATYGSPRVYRALKAQGVPCCENTVAKLMRAERVRAKARPARITVGFRRSGAFGIGSLSWFRSSCTVRCRPQWNAAPFTDGTRDASHGQARRRRLHPHVL